MIVGGRWRRRSRNYHSVRLAASALSVIVATTRTSVRMDAKSPDGPLTAEELAAGFAADVHWAAKFPPVLTVAQAAELMQLPIKTIHDWSSRGLLKNCAFRAGKHLRVLRDRFILELFNKKNNDC